MANAFTCLYEGRDSRRLSALCSPFGTDFAQEQHHTQRSHPRPGYLSVSNISRILELEIEPGFKVSTALENLGVW